MATAFVKLKSRIPQIMASLEPRMDTSLIEGAALIEARAKARAPVVTGRLRSSIHTEDRSGGYAVVADAKDDNGEPYAIYVEFGGHGATGHRGGYGPHAFMYPALEESRAEIIGIAKLSVRKL